MGRNFAAPKQPDAKGWKETREQWRRNQLREIDFYFCQQQRKGKVVLSKKLQTRQERKRTRVAWLEKTRRKRCLKDLGKWTREQS